jgi:GxxExxY protein
MGEPREPDQETDKLAHAVMGAAIEVHRHHGPGFHEEIYQRSMQVELGLRGLPFRPQAPIKVEYKGALVGGGKLDLLVDDLLVVELKAVKAVAPVHKARVLSYLKATGKHLGLLINFNVAVLRKGIHRIIRS